MAAAVQPWAANLLYTWFGVLKPRQWYGRDDALDAMLRRRFAPFVAPLARRSAADFLTDPLTARAAILLFDQIPRNAFRGGSRAFATDPLARTIARGAVARGWHRGLARGQAQFVLLPLMHSERIADQRESLCRFAALGNYRNLQFARDHAAMIARFGRFPHRNDVLGRKSTPAEQRAVAAGHAW